MTQRREIRFTRTARRALSEQLPTAVAVAAFEFITGPLAANPPRVGKQLRGDLYPLFSARRGEYRIVYQVDDAAITVVDVRHLRQAHRPQ